MSVQLEGVGTGRVVKLDAARAARVMTGLAATKSREGPPLPVTLGIAPDCVVRVRTKGSKVDEYEVLGRTVLRNRKTKRSRQFYMGIVLLEWLQ